MQQRKTRTMDLTRLIAMLICLLVVTTVSAEKKIPALLNQCLSCHYIEGAVLPGNIGPPLLAMKARYPNKADLRAQIWDSRVSNPNSIMTPFGAFGVFTPEQIDEITDYVYSL